jgi:hypothetical protein
MASIHRELLTAAAAPDVWEAIRDVGALHTRLVPGFVLDTRLEGDVRVVTFANGLVAREPIVTLDDGARRLAWTSEGGTLRHFHATVQVSPEGKGSRVVWVADFLPHEAASRLGPMMDAGIAAMQRALDALAR